MDLWKDITGYKQLQKQSWKLQNIHHEGYQQQERNSKIWNQ